VSIGRAVALVRADVSPRIVTTLVAAGHDAIRVFDPGLAVAK
jgi:hypothetical protein